MATVPSWLVWLRTHPSSCGATLRASPDSSARSSSGSLGLLRTLMVGLYQRRHGHVRFPLAGTFPGWQDKGMDFWQRYRAIDARDTRFDGQFYTAVRTTGIYCRP